MFLPTLLNLLFDTDRFCDKVKRNFLNNIESNYSSKSYRKVIENGVVIEESMTCIGDNNKFEYVNEDDIIRAHMTDSKNNLMEVAEYLLNLSFTKEDITNFIEGNVSFSDTLNIINAFDTTEEEYKDLANIYYPDTSFVPLASAFTFEKVK